MTVVFGVATSVLVAGQIGTHGKSDWPDVFQITDISHNSPDQLSSQEAIVTLVRWNPESVLLVGC